MKVVLYTHVPSGGHLAYVKEIAYALEMNDVNVMIAGAKASRDVAVERVVSSPALDLRGPRSVLDRMLVYRRQAHELARWLMQQDLDHADIVHLQSLPSKGAARFVRAIRRATSARVVLTVHNVAPHQDGRRLARWIQFAHERAWGRVDAVIVHTERQASELDKRLKSQEIKVVAHPVWRASGSRPDTEPAGFLSFGVLRRNKGLLRLLDALVELGDPPCTVAGRGDAAYVSELADGIASRGLRNCLLDARFISDDDVPNLFARHLVAVLPYEQFDAQSGVLNLAIAHRTPVVVTDVGDLGDTVRGLGVGMVVDRSLSETMQSCELQATNGAFVDPIEAAIEELSPERVGAALVRSYGDVSHDT